MNWLAARLRETSTWAGIITLASGTLHLTISDGMVQAITTLGVAIGGLVSFALTENKE